MYQARFEPVYLICKAGIEPGLNVEPGAASMQSRSRELNPDLCSVEQELNLEHEEQELNPGHEGRELNPGHEGRELNPGN